MRRLLPIALAALFLANIGASQDDGSVVDLPDADRQILEHYLGPDVVGKAVAAKPFDAPGHATRFTQGGSWHYHLTGNVTTPIDCLDQIVPLDRGPSHCWRYESCLGLVDFERATPDGGIELTSTVDHGQGVVSRFDPPVPGMSANFAVGDVVRRTVDVKVYDLTDPSRETHAGHLDITVQYVGAYEVTVPAGTFEAALVKWDFVGKIGPAKYQDFEYRLIAPGSGLVAMVKRKDISAMLYHKRVRLGKVRLK